MRFTYGLEIEAVDFNRDEIKLPEGCLYSAREVTLVNSNGVAVDSSFKTKSSVGGEINTPATQSIEEQIIIAKKCLKLLIQGGATINYRCNAQAHVGGWDSEDERETLDRIKKIHQYCYRHYDRMLMLTMGEGQFKKKPEYPIGFWSHYKERMFPEWKHNFLMSAKSLKEYRDAHSFVKDGSMNSRTFSRQGVNTHSYFKTKTVEFRIFWATLDIKHIQNMLDFVTVIVEDALGNGDCYLDIEKTFKGAFPPEQPFSLELEKGFQKTKVEKPTGSRRYWPQ